jgi:hypothetical protein
MTTWRAHAGGGDDFAKAIGGLVRAVQRESVYALCYWFGVHDLTVWKWRKALGRPQRNEGTLWEANAAAGYFWPGVETAAVGALRRANTASTTWPPTG